MDSELNQVVLLLKSTKKKDRTDGFQKIAILLGTARVENLLCANTKAKVGVTWTVLFSSVHLAAVFEINAGKAISIKAMTEMNTVIGQVVEKARGWIKTETLADAIIDVLSSTNLSLSLGRCYYEVAASHLLERPNRRDLPPKYWKELAELCTEGYKNPPSGGVKKEKYLDLLWKTVQWGLDSLDVVGLLTFLQEALCSATVPSTQHTLLLLVNTCLEAAAPDHRFRIAEFTEAVIPSVLHFYGAGRDHNCLIFQFFSIALHVHHPKGANEGSEMSYAANWLTWRENVDEILKVCQMEMARVCRVGHETPLPQHFMPLIVDLSYIARNRRECGAEEVAVERPSSPLTVCNRRKRKSVEAFGTNQTQKRARVVSLSSPLTNLLADMDSSDRWFWLNYLDVFIDRHPTAVKTEYTDVVLIVTHLLCEVRRAEAFSPLARCASKLIMSSFYKNNATQEARKSMALAWEKSLESLIRSAANENLQDQFRVIEMMAQNLKINLVPVVDVFLNDGIPVSPQNLEALIQIVAAGGVKTENDRCALCRWACENLIHPEATARLVLALASKQYTPPNTPVSRRQGDFQDAYYLVTLYEVPPLETLDEKKPHQTPSLNPKVANCLMESILSHNDSILENLAAGINENSVEVCAVFLKFALLLASEIWEIPRCELKEELLFTIQSLFSKLTSAVSRSIQNATLISLEGLAHLYALDLHPRLHDALRTSNYTDPQMMQALLAFIKRHWFLKSQQEFRTASSLRPSPWLKYASSFDNLGLTRSGQGDSEKMFGRPEVEARGVQAVYLLQVVDLLTQYLIVPGSTAPSTDIVNELIDFMADDAECKYSSPLLLQLVVRVLHGLCCSRLAPDNLARCIGILFDIVSDNHSDTAVHTALLAIFIDRLPHWRRTLNQEAIEHLQRLLTGFRRVLKGRDQKPLDMALSYLRLLKVMCSTLPASFIDDDMVKDITAYLWHRSVEVRALAAETVAAVIRVKPEDAQWHRSVIELVKNQLASVSQLLGYDKIAFTGTSLIALANAFNTSRHRRLPIANFIVKFVKDSNCNDFVTGNFLKHCSALLSVEDSSKYFVKHLKDLIVDWLEEDRLLSGFPYQLLRCTTLQQFYKQQLQIIAFVCFFMAKNNVLKEVATQIDVTLAECLEKGFPLIKTRASSSDIAKILQYFVPNKAEEILEQRLDEFLYFAITEKEKLSRAFFQSAFDQISVLQKLLLLLEEDIVESVTEEDRDLSLSRYKQLVELYFSCQTGENRLPNSEGNQGLQLHIYVFRDAVSVVLRVLAAEKHRTANITAMCCSLLQNVIESSLTLEIPIGDRSIVLPEIVNTLVSISCGNQNAPDPVLRFLRYLIIDRREDLIDTIALLDPFPDEERFSDLNVPSHLDLGRELHRTVSAYKGRRVAGLTRLLKALETQKEELMDMYSEVHAGGKSTSGKLLQKAVHELLQLCGHRDQAVRVEAAKCLGELGPADLGLLVKKSKDITAKTKATPIGERMVDSVMQHLKNLIETEGLVVKKAACAALYAAVKYQSVESQCSAFYAPFLHVSLDVMRPDATTDIAPPNSVWAPGTDITHEAWVTKLTTALLGLLSDSIGLIELLANLCHLHSPTAHYLLPHVLEMTLTVGCTALRSDIVHSINHLLQLHLDGKSGLSIKSVLSVVDAVDYIRCYSFRSNNFNCLPQLNKLNFAKVAGESGAHFISMMYCELWFEDQKNAVYQENRSIWRCNVDDLGPEGANLSRIMRAAFVNVGVLDGLQGCGSSHLADPTQILAHMEQIGRWDVALVGHDVAANHTGIVRSFRNSGLISAISQLPVADQDTKLSCAALLGDWSHVLSAESTPSFHLHHYSALKSLHEQDHSSALVEVERATNLVLEHFSSGQVGSARTLYHYLSHLQCLKQLRDIVEAKSENAVATLAKKWSVQDQLEPNDFSLLEEIVTTRCVAIKQVAQMYNALGWNEVVAHLHLRLCELARKANRHDVALRNSQKVRQMFGDGHHLLNCAKVEEAQYFWAQGEQKTATFLLNTLINDLQSRIMSETVSRADIDLQTKCLRIYGNWMAETKTESSTKIYRFFKDSLSLSLSLKSSEANIIESCASLAKFADSLFVQMKEYRESAEFAIRIEAIERRHEAYKDLMKILKEEKDEAEKAKKEGRLEKAEKKPKIEKSVQSRIIYDNKEADIDAIEIQDFESQLCGTLVSAVRHYAYTLQTGDKYDHLLFRLFSMWLNCPEWGRGSIHVILESELPKIPSHKFITLLPQIAPRMHENRLLEEIVERCLKEHPHHTLPIVMAISKANEDAPANSVAETTDRMRHADNLLSKMAVIPALTPLVRDMTIFFTVTIQLANYNDPSPLTTVAIPQNILGQLRNLDYALMPTVTLAPQPSMIYGDIVGVSQISPSYDLVGGVNKPKRVVMTGTDGSKQNLLVKGNDDPRQDAMMQQVFGVVNGVLARDEAAARKQLRMRTYRVMPLTQRSGVIQWCADTQPLGLYLTGPVGRSGAHVRLRPNDLNPLNARQMYRDMKDEDAATKLERFLKICEGIKPVLNYFFLENFPSADIAFEKRLAFTKSVATSSMIGYVMGLGDRHVNNILIDNLSGEVIHIDFGIAFEMGRALRTPETIPFRLTRDMVDGMGVCGVDGVFRASCQRTMTVMREHKDVMITLLEVLLYDPLYSWGDQINKPAEASPPKEVVKESTTTATEPSTSEPKTEPSTSAQATELPAKVRAAEPSTNARATRVLQRVTMKLQGMEDRGLATVEGQVNGLLQKAQDPANLSKLFHGWQPYL